MFSMYLTCAFVDHCVTSAFAPLQNEGDYLCVKVLRHSKSKKTMVRRAMAALFGQGDNLCTITTPE